MSSPWTLILLSCLLTIVHFAAAAEQDCNKVEDHFCLPEERCSQNAVNLEAKGCAEKSVCCHRLNNTIDPCRNRAGGECVSGECRTEALPESCPAKQKCCVLVQ